MVQEIDRLNECIENKDSEMDDLKGKFNMFEKEFSRQFKEEIDALLAKLSEKDDVLFL